MTAPIGSRKGNENVVDETDTVEATGGLFDSLVITTVELLESQPTQRPPTDDGSVIDETSLPAPEAGLTSNVLRLEHKRESVRSVIAYMLAGALVGVVVIGAVGWLVIKAPLQEWTTFTSPLFTLVATMVGYYYGRRDS